MNTSVRANAWFLVAVGLLLIGLNELAVGARVSVYIVGGAAFAVGLAGLLFRR